MFKIGDKVVFGSSYKMTGYIVGINIDPGEEGDVNFDKKNWVNYTIRVFADFYKDGFADFRRTEDEMIPEDFQRCCQAKREIERYQKEYNEE